MRLAAQVRAPFDDLRGVFEKRGTRDRAVKVTAAPTFGKRWLPPRIPRFLALYPDVTIEIEASVDLRSIEGREFDVGVRSGYGQWPGLIAHELVPVVPRTHAVAVARKVARRHRARRGPAACAAAAWEAAWQDWFKAAGIGDWSSARRLRMSFETQDVLADVAQTGVGVALLSPFIFREEITAKRLICPVGPTLPGPENFYVVYDPARRDPARDLFIGWLRATVAAEMALPPPNGIPQWRRRRRGVGAQALGATRLSTRRIFTKTFRRKRLSTFVPSRLPIAKILIAELRRSSAKLRCAAVICLPTESCAAMSLDHSVAAGAGLSKASTVGALTNRNAPSCERLDDDLRPRAPGDGGSGRA